MIPPLSVEAFEGEPCSLTMVAPPEVSLYTTRTSQPWSLHNSGPFTTQQGNRHFCLWKVSQERKSENGVPACKDTAVIPTTVSSPSSPRIGPELPPRCSAPPGIDEPGQAVDPDGGEPITGGVPVHTIRGILEQISITFSVQWASRIQPRFGPMVGGGLSAQIASGSSPYRRFCPPGGVAPEMGYRTLIQAM